MLEQPRGWRATLDGKLLGTFTAPPRKAFEKMSERWPTPVASGRVVMERDPDELAREKRQGAAARG